MREGYGGGARPEVYTPCTPPTPPLHLHSSITTLARLARSRTLFALQPTPSFPALFWLRLPESIDLSIQIYRSSLPPPPSLPVSLYVFGILHPHVYLPANLYLPTVRPEIARPKTRSQFPRSKTPIIFARRLLRPDC